MEAQVLSEAAGIDVAHAQLLCESMNGIFERYDISTPERQAAFIAQCGHESDGFRFMEENLNYKAESLMRTWPKHFPTMDIAQEYAHQPRKIASRAYANRMQNGPEETEDGWTYRGRGYLQLTGKAGYEMASDDLQIDFVGNPDIVGTVEGAMATAGWFWEKHNLNRYADNQDIEAMTKIINGGTIGLEARYARFEKALKVIRGQND